MLDTQDHTASVVVKGNTVAAWRPITATHVPVGCMLALGIAPYMLCTYGQSIRWNEQARAGFCPQT